MISMSVAIMAHPKRRKQVDHVLAQLGVDVPIVWDRKNDRWDTGRRSMLAYDPACSHHLVIQDDCLVCKDLIPGVIKAVEHMPEDSPLCLYMGKRRPREHFVVRAAAQADEGGASFITMRNLNWGPGIVVPTNIIPEMIAYCDPLVDVLNYDKRLSRYWQFAVGKRVWYTYPSLLDHADGPSLVPGRLGTNRTDHRHARVAHRFLGEERSALSLDWDGPVIHADGPFRTGEESEEASLSAVVMAHPKRAQMVEELMEALGQRIPVVWDTGEDRWDTGRRAMLAYDKKCTHHLVIQDDAIPCRDLIAGVRRALQFVPRGVPISLYLGRHKRIADAVRQAETVNPAFISWRLLDHGLGVVVPTGQIDKMISFADERTEIENYDARLSSYWEAQGIPTFYTWPSLIEHAPGESLIGHRANVSSRRVGRVARYFLGRDKSALDLEWTRGVVYADEARPVVAVSRRAKGQSPLAVFRHTTSGRTRTVPAYGARARQYRGLSHWEEVEVGI